MLQKEYVQIPHNSGYSNENHPSGYCFVGLVATKTSELVSVDIIQTDHSSEKRVSAYSDKWLPIC